MLKLFESEEIALYLLCEKRLPGKSLSVRGSQNKWLLKKCYLFGEQTNLPGKLVYYMLVYLFGEHLKPPGKIKKKVLLEEKNRYFHK